MDLTMNILFYKIAGCLIMGLTVFCQSTENTDNGCIPNCANSLCSDSCPDDMYLFISDNNENKTDCVYPTTTPSTSTFSSTEDYQDKTTYTPPYALSDNSTVYYFCYDSCPMGYYGNKSYVCVQCDSLCTACSGSGSTVDVCECRYGDRNGTCLTETHKSDDGIDKIIIIGAAAGGGGVVLIIILVVVICCCCRKKRQRSSASRMSVLLNTRDADKDNETVTIEPETSTGGGKSRTLQRQNYENTGKFDDSKVAQHAQLNQDKIFRYVKDPVTGKQTKVKVSQEQRVSDTYSNAAAIRLNKSLQGVSNEDIEIAMLGDAPKPPGIGKKKKSMFKKISSKRKTHKKDDKKGHVNHGIEQEDYEDMSGNPSQPVSGNEDQPNYTQFDPTMEEPQENYENYQKESEMPLEDYENFGKTSTLSKQDDEEMEDYENVQKALAKANMDDEEPKEDYENFNLRATVQARANLENISEENPYMNIQYKK